LLTVKLLFVRLIFVTRFVLISDLFAKILMFSFYVIVFGCIPLLSFSFFGCGLGTWRTLSFAVADEGSYLGGSFDLAPAALDLAGEV